MKKIVLGLFLCTVSEFLFSEIPFCTTTQRSIIKVNGTKHVIIRSVDQEKRWVMHNTCLIIESVFGRLHINGKPLATNDIMLCVGENNIIIVNGISFKSMVHVVCRNNQLICSGMVHQNNEGDYRSYHLADIQKNIEQFTQQIDYAITDQLIKIKHQEQVKIVKVLLATACMDEQNFTEWTLEAEQILKMHKREHEEVQAPVTLQKISVVVGHNKVLINGSVMKSSILYIEPQETYIQYNEKKYKGGFIIVKEKEKVLLINTVDLEEYIYAVVRSESWPGWPLEVNKVFAISCRSYALSLITEAQRAKRLYHIRDTNVHQRYNLYGEHKDTTVRQAVEDTKGVCLTYKDMPVLAMFDSCCGGIKPVDTKAFHFTEENIYLARQYPCTFCKKTSLYSWQVTYDLATFEKMIAKRALHVFPLKKIRIHTVDKAGVVKDILVEGHKKSIKLSAKWLSAVAKEIKSCFFTVELRGKKLMFKGNGLGHLIGLCQWGAWQMVKEGWDYKSILRYYYPSTTLKRLL